MSFIEVTNVFYKKAALVPEIGHYCKTNPKALTDRCLGAIDIRARKGIVRN